MTPNVCVIVPTIRPEEMKKFKEAWEPLFSKHNVTLLTVWDGDKPVVEIEDGTDLGKIKATIPEIMGKYGDCLTNKNGSIRNLGFAYAYRFLKPDFYLTLDDDEIAVGDTIQDHIDALNMRVPVSWMAVGDAYTRGFPYSVRDEAEVVLSHGVWNGVMDWDAPTQLVNGNHQINFNRMPIPKGIYYPMCVMNVAFKPCVLPWIYQTPKALGVVRASDIMSGIVSKRAIDEHGWAAVTGYARTHHIRASNVYKNLVDEAVEIGLYETFWKGDESHPYFKVYREKLAIWQEFLKKYES